MRSCDEIVELISASLDGELSADEQTALDEHIARCSACSALLDDLRALHTVDWEDVPAPAGFTEAVMSAIAAEPVQEKADKVIPFVPKKAARTHWKKWGVSAAAIAIVVLGAVSAPSLMGNFAYTKSDSAADMVCARDDAAVAAADMAEAQFFSAVEHSKTSESAEVEDRLDGSIFEETLEQNTTKADHGDPDGGLPLPSATPESVYYVGELILEGPLDILEPYEGTANRDGTVTYLVPADVFADVLELLETEKPVGYAYGAGTSDAELGRIVAPGS